MEMSNLAKRMVITIIAIAFISIFISVVYYRSWGFLSFSIGVTLGSGLSILKVFLLKRAIEKVLGMEGKMAGSYISLQHILRLLLTGLVLLLGALVPQVNLWGVVVGVFAFQIAIYTVRFASKS